MSNVVNLDNIGWVINDLQEKYNNGVIKGIMIQFLHNDGTFYTFEGGEISYLEMLGMLEAAKDSIRQCRYVSECYMED